jgi:hypothetical protein
MAIAADCVARLSLIRLPVGLKRGCCSVLSILALVMADQLAGNTLFWGLITLPLALKV